jgi:hypothetical protein
MMEGRMNQRWWIAIVAIVGIGLAFLLFPRPDTGGDIPDPDPQNQPFKGAKRDPNQPRPPIPPDRVSTGPKPGMEELVAKRNRVEVVYATKLVTPFSAMRYTLSREGSPEAKALADEVAATMGELRTIRLDPDSMTWEEMQAKTDAMIAKVAASPYSKDPSITKSLERYKQFITEYEQAKSGQPVPAPAGEDEEVPGAPPSPGGVPMTPGVTPGAAPAPAPTPGD